MGSERPSDDPSRSGRPPRGQNHRIIPDGVATEREHPQQIIVNWKSYGWPSCPVVIICIDGGSPEYVTAALERDLLPNMKKFMNQGFSAVAHGAMPSFTNPNNISIITGLPPSLHGISGNYSLNPETGKAVK